MTFPRFHRHLHKWETEEIGGQHKHDNTTVIYGGVQSRSGALGTRVRPPGCAGLEKWLKKGRESLVMHFRLNFCYGRVLNNQKVGSHLVLCMPVFHLLRVVGINLRGHCEQSDPAGPVGASRDSWTCIWVFQALTRAQLS